MKFLLSLYFQFRWNKYNYYVGHFSAWNKPNSHFSNFGKWRFALFFYYRGCRSHLYRYVHLTIKLDGTSIEPHSNEKH